MEEIRNNAFFWQKIDTLIFSNDLYIHRPKGDHHPEYKNLVYPVDYGYLKETQTSQESLFMFKGTSLGLGCNGVIVAADILKKEVSVKFLVDCSEEEETSILEFLNQTEYQKAVLIHRTNVVPSWGMST
ncbi:MAG: Inorganic pyrophosphatase [Anaerorhabdus sp.]